MNKITVSAPGKLMLLGEHSVVYNRPCIVTAVGQRMRAIVQLTSEPIFELKAPDVNVSGYKKPMSELGHGEIPKGAKFVEIAIKNFLLKHNVALNKVEGITKKSYSSLAKPDQNDKFGIKVTTKSEFSSEFGFGSSSASTVCVIKALSELTGKKLTNKQIFDLAYKTVLDIQGKGSGFDVAAAIFGGTLYFVTGGKVIKPLNLKSLPLMIGYSGVKADTVTLINQVAARAQKYPQEFENIYNSITRLIEMGKKALLKSDWVTFGELMNLNQGYLESLGVSIRKLSDMIYAAREVGAYGAKLSGAGGGDCIITLADSKKKSAISTGIESVGGKFIDIKVNVEGVRIET